MSADREAALARAALRPGRLAAWSGAALTPCVRGPLHSRPARAAPARPPPGPSGSPPRPAIRGRGSSRPRSFAGCRRGGSGRRGGSPSNCAGSASSAARERSFDAWVEELDALAAAAPRRRGGASAASPRRWRRFATPAGSATSSRSRGPRCSGRRVIKLVEPIGRRSRASSVAKCARRPSSRAGASAASNQRRKAGSLDMSTVHQLPDLRRARGLEQGVEVLSARAARGSRSRPPGAARDSTRPGSSQRAGRNARAARPRQRRAHARVASGAAGATPLAARRATPERTHCPTMSRIERMPTSSGALHHEHVAKAPAVICSAARSSGQSGAA